MGISPYIDDDLRAGRLVAPFKMSVPKGMHWYLVYRDARSREPGFAAFRKWVIKATGWGGELSARRGQIEIFASLMTGPHLAISAEM